MRFFSGTRDSGKKKNSASAMYKKKLQGEVEPVLTAEEKYKKMLDAKMAQIMMDIAMGKKKGFKLPGTKEDDAPKAMSKNYVTMLETLARQKAEKEIKQQRKKAQDIERAEKKAQKADQAKKGGSIFFDFSDSVFKDNT